MGIVRTTIATAAIFWGSSAILFLVPLVRFAHRRDLPDAPASPRLSDRVTFYSSSPAALGIGFAICLTATAMTGSRAGLLLSICAFLLACVLYLAPLPLGNLRRWALAGGAAVAALLILQLVGGAVAGRIGTYGLIDEQRLGAYQRSVAIIRDYPLLGVGWGNFETTFPAPDGRRVEGRHAVAREWEPVFAQTHARFEFEEIFGAADRIVQRWRYDWGDGHVRGVDVLALRDGRIGEKLSYVKG